MEIKELGHIVLYVRNVERSAAFYRGVLGWGEVERINGSMAMFSSGRTHHELLLLEVGESAAKNPAGRRIGLYHFGLKIGTTDEELTEALVTLSGMDVPIAGTADHTVTHSVYLLDPDGNEVELYVDVQPEVWRDDPKAVAAPTKPLRLTR